MKTIKLTPERAEALDILHELIIAVSAAAEGFESMNPSVEVSSLRALVNDIEERSAVLWEILDEARAIEEPPFEEPVVRMN
jgi:hypothetical protein